MLKNSEVSMKQSSFHFQSQYYQLICVLFQRYLIHMQSITHVHM